MADVEAASSSSAAPPGRMVGPYRLFGKIGSGGMGTVHLGRFYAPGGFRRIVAIKRLHPHYAEDAAFVTAFLEEARLASRIHHPNVVASLDVVSEDGEVFLVFEHVPGASLATLSANARARGEAIPLRITVSVMLNVLHGLHAAHEATGDHGELLDLVHRDVTPQNVLVGRDGSARLLDFGIAKAAGRTQHTEEGIVKGKRGYMAPEHLTGASSQASDVYSAAVMLWEIITGERLFPDDTSIGRRLAGAPIPAPSSIARKRSPVTSPLVSASPNASTLAFAAPDALSRVSAAPDASTLAALDAVVAKGLAHAPSDRYASARDMAIALEALDAAPTREVAEWVERIARAELEARAHLIAQAERTGATDAPPLVTTTASAAVAIPIFEATGAGMVSTSEVVPRSRNRLVLPMIALLLVGGIALAFTFAHRPSPATVVAVASAPPVLVAATPPSAAPVVDSSPSASGSSAAASSVAAASVVAPSVAAITSSSTKPHPTGGAKKHAPACKPYVIDADGHTKFNEACLR